MDELEKYDNLYAKINETEKENSDLRLVNETFGKFLLV